MKSLGAVLTAAVLGVLNAVLSQDYIAIERRLDTWEDGSWKIKPDRFSIPSSQCSDDGSEQCLNMRARKRRNLRCMCACNVKKNRVFIRSTFSFYNNQWQCFENAKVRNHGECAEVLDDDLNRNSHSPLLTGPNGQEYYASSLTDSCRIASGKYLKCDGNWEQVENAIVKKWFSVRDTYYIYFSANPPPHPNITGRVIRLEIHCTDNVDLVPTTHCALLKVAGKLNCPYPLPTSSSAMPSTMASLLQPSSPFSAYSGSFMPATKLSSSGKEQTQRLSLISPTLTMPVSTSTSSSPIITHYVSRTLGIRSSQTLAPSQSTSTGTSERSTSTGTSERSTSTGTSERSTIIGTSERSTITGTSERSTSTGTSERSTITGTSERSTSTGTSERSTITGTSERSTSTGTSERSTITGTSERSTSTGTSERSTSTGTRDFKPTRPTKTTEIVRNEKKSARSDFDYSGLGGLAGVVGLALVIVIIVVMRRRKRNAVPKNTTVVENASYGRGVDDSLRFNDGGQQSPNEDKYSYAYTNTVPFAKTNVRNMENNISNNQGRESDSSVANLIYGRTEELNRPASPPHHQAPTHNTLEESDYAKLDKSKIENPNYCDGPSPDSSKEPVYAKVDKGRKKGNSDNISEPLYDVLEGSETDHEDTTLEGLNHEPPCYHVLEGKHPDGAPVYDVLEGPEAPVYGALEGQDPHVYGALNLRENQSTFEENQGNDDMVYDSVGDVINDAEDIYQQLNQSGQRDSGVYQALSYPDKTMHLSELKESHSSA